MMTSESSCISNSDDTKIFNDIRTLFYWWQLTYPPVARSCVYVRSAFATISRICGSFASMSATRRN